MPDTTALKDPANKVDPRDDTFQQHASSRIAGREDFTAFPAAQRLIAARQIQTAFTIRRIVALQAIAG